MLIVLALTLVLSTFTFNYNVTLPVLAKITLHGQGYVYGFLSAVFGAGALAGALFAASRARASMRVLLLGAGVFTCSTTLLATGHNVWFAGVMLFLVGAGFTAWSANSNASIQLAAPDRLRGRIIGLYFYAFNGTGAVAGIFAGWLCDRGGTELAFAVAGVVGLLATAGAAFELRGRRPVRPELRPREARAA